MTKLQFLLSLNDCLAGLPKDDIEGYLAFYTEIIEDRIEEGLSEEDAVNSVGSPQEIAAKILSDKSYKQKNIKRRKLKAWEIVLLALGSPIWISLLVAAFAVVISLYASLWAVIGSLWACFGAAIVCGVYCVIFGIGTIVSGSVLTGIAFIGAGILCGGLSIFMFFGCKLSTVGTALLTKKFFLWIKNRITNKEDAQ